MQCMYVLIRPYINESIYVLRKAWLHAFYDDPWIVRKAQSSNLCKTWIALTKSGYDSIAPLPSFIFSLSLKKHSRFADVSEETVESFACASFPKNSALNGKWTMRNLAMVV